MVVKVAYFSILGKPLIAWLGLLTLLTFVATALVGFLLTRGRRIPFKLHWIMAITALTLAVVHGTLGFLV